jgi:hypothetical protein
VLDAAGIPITGGTLYGAHFLGAGGAKQAFRNDDSARMADVVGPGVVRANPFLVNMTVGDFKRWTAKKGGGASIDLSRSGGADALAGAGGNDVIAGGGKNDVALGGVDPYGALPATDTLGEDQRAKFRDWNSDPIANEASILQGVDPALAGVIKRAKQIAGTNFVVASGQRTPEMQAKAKKFGWSKTLDSDHLGGGASDLWPVDEKGQIVFDKTRQAKIVDAMKQAAQEMGVDLEAGADWKTPDRPHFGMVGQTPMNGPIPAARPDGGGVDPVVTGSTSAGPSLIQARPVPVNAAGLNTPRGQEFLGRMGSPAPMGGGPQSPPMIPGMNGPMPLRGTPTTPLPMPPQARQVVPPPPAAAPVPPPQAQTPAPAPPQPVPTPPPAPAPVPPAPPPQVDPFTDMILGDKAAQFKPGNYIPPAPVGQQVFPVAPPAPGTPAAAGFGVPPVVGGGGADQLAGKGTFPPAPAPPQAAGGGGPQNVVGKLMTILASPYASDEQKRMAEAMLNREYALEAERRKAASPEAMLDMEYKRALIEKAKAEAGGAGKLDNEAIAGMQKTVLGLDSFKELSKTARAYRGMIKTVEQAAKAQGGGTKVSDLNLIFSLGKIFDPTSVVRANEVDEIKAQQAWPDWLYGAYKGLEGKAGLGPDVRQAILDEAYTRVQAAEDQYSQETQFFSDYVKRNGVLPQDVIPNMGKLEPWRSSGATSPSVKKKADKFLGGGG